VSASQGIRRRDHQEGTSTDGDPQPPQDLLQLGLKNKLQYASMHGHQTWVSNELLSPWDLAGQWNKVALLLVLLDRESTVAPDADWLMWVDDDALFCV
jgi:hypothetical protein